MRRGSTTDHAPVWNPLSGATGTITGQNDVNRLLAFGEGVRWTLMEKDETRQQVIALLTATYTTLREGGTDFVEMTGPLINDLLSISFDFDITYTGDIKGFAQAVAEQAVRELQPSVGTLIETFLSAFIVLSQEYEAACPDADVPRILQEFALSGQDPTES